MSEVKILHNHVYDEIKDGNLKLYFPHNLDLKKSPDIIKNKFWLDDSGFRHKIVNKKRTDIIYPFGFDVASCFEDRDVFNYVSGFNKTKNVKLSKNDFFVFIFSKFLKSSGVCEKSYSYMFDYSESRYSKSKLKYFNTMSKVFDNDSDEKIFTNDLKPMVEPIDFVKSRLLKAKPDSTILEIVKSENIKSDSSSTDLQIKKIYLPNLIVKGLEGELFENIINKLNDFFGAENYKVYYNIIVGAIFSFDLQPEEIEIDFSDKKNLIDSGGLFITNTYTKLSDLGIVSFPKDTFNSNVLSYHKSKSSWYFNPNILYKSLMVHCQKINEILENSDYDLSQDDNVTTFLSGMMEDLVLGMKSLGMFLVDDIDVNIK
jgi:hypothetical protein